MIDEIEYPIEKTYIFVDGEWIEGEPIEGQEFKREIEVSDGAFVTVIDVKRPHEPEPRLITKLAFKQRMTQTERIEIRELAKTNDAIFDFMDLLGDSAYIDLDHSETIAGVNALKSLGVFDGDRADSILNDEIQPIELPL